jgi:hypothetical protein
MSEIIESKEVSTRSLNQVRKSPTANSSRFFYDSPTSRIARRIQQGKTNSKITKAKTVNLKSKKNRK